MHAILEIQTGSRAGETIVVAEGQTVTVGRTANATFALPQDTFLSRVHFAVEGSGSTYQLVDRQSANGTRLNGSRVAEPVDVHDGDVIEAGQTKFLVRIAAEAAPPPAAHGQVASRPSPPPPKPVDVPDVAAAPGTLAVGSWFFGAIPEGWQVVDGFGLRRRERNSFPAEAMVSETALAGGQSFDTYVGAQLELLQFLISQPQIQLADPPAIRGAEETRAFTVRYRMNDVQRFVQRQIYVRRGETAGALSVTTLENEAPAIQPVLDQILRGLGFGKPGL